MADEFDVSLILVSGSSQMVLPSVRVVTGEDFDEAELVQGLIGRDVLDHCLFTYYGPQKHFVLVF